MQIKKIASIALASAAIGSAASAAPFLAIGDGAELFILGTLGVRSDDNVKLSTDNEISDTIFDINPGVQITFGKNAQFSGSLTLVDAFANYSDNSSLNTQLFSGDFVSKYDDGKLKLNFSAGYHELNQNTADIQGLSRRDQFVVSAGTEVEVSQITSVGAAINFDHTNYKRKTFNDYDDLSIPLNFYYKFDPKIDLSAGYRYRNFEASGTSKDSTDHFFNVGARGQFTEKLKGTVAVGITTRKVDGGGSEDIPGAEGSLTYEITPKTSIQFGFANDFGTAPQGEEQKNFTLNAGIVSKIDEQWAVNAGITRRSIDYYTTKGGREDVYFEGTVGVSYIINAYATIKAGYAYRNNDSDIATPAGKKNNGVDFTNNVFSLSANFRY